MILLAATAAYPYAAHNRNDSSPAIHVFAGSSSPLVYIAPSSISTLTAGSTFNVQVKVSNMPQFVGWDILVLYDPTIINATSVSIAGNDFAVNASSGTPFEIVNCVNGAGTGCTSSDGKGIAHSAFGNGGSSSLTGGGLLFTVTFKVTTTNPASWGNISLTKDKISDPNSGSGVPHVTGPQTLYGNALSATGAGGGGGGVHFAK